MYLLGRNFPERELVRKVLTSLYGISGSSKTCFARAPAVPTAAPSPKRYNVLSRLMAQHYIHPTATLGELPDTQLNSLVNSLSQMTIENDLRRKVLQNIARLRDMGSYRGRRHAFGLPVRGQRTRTQVSFGMLVVCSTSIDGSIRSSRHAS